MLKWAVFPKPAQFRRRIVGSDPRAATCRGKLQSKRSKLNMEINRELMLRSGAENLYKVTTDRKTKETVALELSFVNSNLQLLKEQLAELNSNVEIYQASQDAVIPMIPLGLKETKELEMQDVLLEMIEKHYYEDKEDYEEAVAELSDLRQAMRTPSRDAHGIALLFRYYNQLYFLERRFFPPDKSSGLHFEWYDSLTGVPQTQKTVAFERASVMFNIGGLYTQIGTRQDRCKEEGLDTAVDNFLRAAGTFQYILENFCQAPSWDLEPDTLHMLVQLMCAQARECLYEKAVIGAKEEKGLVLGQEAAHLSQSYHQVLEMMEQVRECVPYSWISLVQVKEFHYRGLSDQHVSWCLLSEKELSPSSLDTLQYLHHCTEITEEERPKVPRTTKERYYLGKAHLREALLAHEEALRVHRMCRELRRKDALQEVLRNSHQEALSTYEDIDQEDDFEEVLEPPPVLAATSIQLSLSFPDFSSHRVKDLFQNLGPESVFSAKHRWSPPRSLQLSKHSSEGFGLSVRGDAPVAVAEVEEDSLAKMAGLRQGDLLVAVGDTDVRWQSHDSVVKMIRQSGNTLSLKIVSPTDPWRIRPKEIRGDRMVSDTSSKSSLHSTTNLSQSSKSYSASSTSSSSSSSSFSDCSTRTRPLIQSWNVIQINK